MFGQEDLPSGQAEFFPLTQKEYQHAYQNNLNPRHMRFDCGACGVTTQGRVLCSLTREVDGSEVHWCVCACEKQEPAVLTIEKGTGVVTQSPIAREFHTNAKWPPALRALYDEAAKSYSAGAFTACAMVCRKLLMATACNEGDVDGRAFVDYVTYITEKVLTFPRAKSAIDKLRGIGNEANHKVAFVVQDDAKRAMQIVTYMLDTIYTFPTS